MTTTFRHIYLDGQRLEVPTAYPPVNEPIEPGSFGAKGDGVTDDRGAIQNALNVAGMVGGTVVFTGDKTYAVTSALSVPSNVKIEGNGALIDCSAMAWGDALNQKFGIKIEGSIGASTPLTASAAIGTTSILCNTAGLAVDDIILISSAEVHPVGAIGNGNRKGEMHRIRYIDSASALTIMDGIFLSYDYTQTAIVQKITPAVGVTIKNLRLKMGGVGSVHNGVRMLYTDDCWLEQCEISHAEDCGVRPAYCFGGGVSGGTYSYATSPNYGGSTTGVTGYGVVAGSGCRDFIIEKANFYNCRHAISGGGLHPPFMISVLDNSIAGSRIDPGGHYDIDNHEDCMYWVIRGNKISGDGNPGGSGGIMIRGQYTIVDGNLVVNACQYGILVHSFDNNPNGLKGAKIVNNIVIGARLTGIFSNGDIETPIFNVEIAHNRVENCGSDAIILASTKGGSISDNDIVNTLGETSSGIRLLGAVDDPIIDITIANNRVDTVPLYALRADYAERIAVSGLSSLRSGNAGAHYENCSGISHIGGRLTTVGATVHGIHIIDCSKMTIAGVVADGGTGATFSTGVSISGTSSDISITGCLFYGYQYPVRATGTVDYISVVGVNGRNCNVAVDIVAAANNVDEANL